LKRAGYTIFEILMVLAVLVLILSLAWPTIESFQSEYRVRQGGQLVQARLAAARVHAVESGLTYQFRFEPGGQRFLVLPVDQQALLAPAQGRRPKKLAGILPSDKAMFDPSSTGSAGGQQIPGEWLAGIPDADKFGGATWSAPAYFYADGTASAVRLVIRDKKSHMVTVSVRPLTGSVSVSKVERGAQ
jgi:hypothetical protein